MAITGEWEKALHGEFAKPYYRELYKTVLKEYRTREIYPPSTDIFNAFKFTPENGTIDVHLSRLSIDGSDWHSFTITNSGSGISPE